MLEYETESKLVFKFMVRITNLRESEKESKIVKFKITNPLLA